MKDTRGLPNSGSGSKTLERAERCLTDELGLGPVVVKHLIERGSFQEHARRAVVWEDGQPAPGFAFLLEGRVKAIKSDAEGRDVILDVPTPGQILCTPAPLAMVPFCCRGVVQGDRAATLTVARRDVLDLAERYSEVAFMLLDETARRCQTLCHRLGEVSAVHVAERIARLLLRLARDVGRHETDGSIVISVGFARQELADLCATSVETAIRIMRRFETSGVLDTLDPGFRVKDRAALEQVAAGAWKPWRGHA